MNASGENVPRLKAIFSHSLGNTFKIGLPRTSQDFAKLLESIHLLGKLSSMLLNSTDEEMLSTINIEVDCTMAMFSIYSHFRNFAPPHFYRKYAPPFSEGSFLKILWEEMPG